jgi:hypothetical protein
LPIAAAAFERAKHQADAPVFPKVRDGLHAAAGEIEIREVALVEDRERAVEPLRREVDVTLSVEGEVATKNIFWDWMQSRSAPSIASKTLAIRATLTPPSSHSRSHTVPKRSFI